MEKFYFMRAMVTFITIVLILVITVIVFVIGGFWFGLPTLILLTEEFFRRSIYDLPANPPTKAIPMVWGKFIEAEIPPGPETNLPTVENNEKILLDPGWYFIPFRGSIFLDLQEITGKEIAIRFVTKEVIPRDRSEVAAPVAIYIAVDPHNPAQVFIVSGSNNASLDPQSTVKVSVEDPEFKEVAKRLQEQVDQLLRKWIVSPHKGPQSMDQARQMSDEAINEILESLLAHDVQRIHPEIPTEIILAFFGKHRQLTPQEKRWQRTLEELSPEDLEKLHKVTQERFDLIQEMRNGNQHYPLHGLGIVIRRMVVGNMEPTDETKIAVADVASARFFAEKQAILTKSVEAEANTYKNIPGVKDPLEQTLLRRDITHKETKVSRIETSPELTGVIEKLGTMLIEAITKKGGK